jgi:hypothetical protein
MVDKLKCRIVFRGDLYNPQHPMDSWNPHANWLALKLFLAICAKFGMYPSQSDFVMAYLQVPMRGERVFVKFPDFWSDFLPDDLKPYCGVPLLLIKALYGYTLSGKFLYEDQADWLQEKQRMRASAFPALWYRWEEGNVLLVLQYADDFLYASNKPEVQHKFTQDLGQRFKIERKLRADWYLNARISQDASKNIMIDQRRYALAIVSRYIPNAPTAASAEDIKLYRNPQPLDHKWTREDCSKTVEEVRVLEQQYGFRYPEVVGSLNFLSNSTYKQLFTMRKCCSYMQKPGPAHFKALNHLLHHLRCHPPKPIMFYHKVHESPLANMLIAAGHSDVETSFVTFTDSSWADCDDQRSTACYVILIQGGPVDASSHVPAPIANSSAESETNALSVAAMQTSHVRQIYCDIMYGDREAPYTVPVFMDSTAGMDVAKNERGTKKTKHIERRWLYGRQQQQEGRIKIYHVDGVKYQLADLGTKAVSTEEAAFKLSIVEAPDLTVPAGSEEGC